MILVRIAYGQKPLAHSVSLEDQSGKSGIIRESNQASGVRRTHYAYICSTMYENAPLC